MVNPHAQRWEEIRRQNRDQGLAKRLFRVVGPRAVAGKCTGETVELETTRAQADALIIAGHVVEIDPNEIAETEVVQESEVAPDEAPAEPDPEIEPVATPKRGRKAQS